MQRTNPRNRSSNAAPAALALAITLIVVGGASAQAVSGQKNVPQARAARIQELVDHALAHRHAADREDAAVCVELSNMSVLFDPGVDAEKMTDALGNAGDDAYAAFDAGHGLWTYTATDGSVTQGDPITITYSFLPDGTTIPGAYDFTESEESVLFATLDAEFPGGRSAWKAAFAEAFERWGELTNVNYVEVSDDGAPFPGAFGQLGLRGDVRIGMRRIGAPLAYNYYPTSGGDMVLDSLDLGTLLNPANNYRNLHNTLTHEHGHGIGLGHSIPQNSTKLMEPALNTAFAGPQEDDIRGAHYLYGDPYERNDGYGSETFFGDDSLRPIDLFGPQVYTLEGMALERADSVDFYGFTAFADAHIAIKVEPVGTTYQAGPQNGDAVEVDAKAARDLGLRLYRRVSFQTGELDLLAQIDFNEAGVAEYHPPLSYTMAGYMVLEVYSNDGIDDVQEYKVTISNTDIVEEEEPGALFVTRGVEVVEDGDTEYVEGDTEVGGTGGFNLVLTNIGDGPLHFTGTPKVRVEGANAADYSAGSLPDELAPDGTAILSITFSPTAVGQRVALVTIPTDDPDLPEFSFIVSGAAIEASIGELSVSLDDNELASNGTLDLGTAEVGQAVDTLLTLENVGNADLTVIGTSRFDGTHKDDFLIVDGLPVTLAPGQQSDLLVSWVPTAAGEREATLRLNMLGQSAFFLNFAGEALDPVVDDPNEPQDPNDGNDDVIDTDGDGTPDDLDGCPDDPAKTEPGICGCGVSDLDSDGDGLLDCEDAFPDDPFNGEGDPNEPADPNDGNDDVIDTDGDGTPDDLDGCPDDPAKTEPGICGCGVSDLDSDGDGLLDCEDPFPNDPFNGQNPDDPNEVADPNFPNDGGFDPNDGGFDPDDPFVPAPCGFGAGLASMMCMLSLAGQRCGRRTRR